VIMGDDDGGTPVGREDNLTLQWNQVAEGGLCDYGSARLSLRSHEAKLIT
jgi:hypothetical protein